jgi:hypothetical protein
MYMFYMTTNRYQGGFSTAPLLLVTLLSASSLTSNTAMVDTRARTESVSRYEPLLGDLQNTSNTEPEVLPARLTHTDAGPSEVVHAREITQRSSASFEARHAIHELKRLSGLTWEDLANLLSVTRRSLHLWANGGPINTPNEKLVRDMLITLRAMDRGTATENRRLMLTPIADGRVFTDLLRSRQFAEAIAFAGRSGGRSVHDGTATRRATPEASSVSVADRLGTLSGRVHTDRGSVLSSRRRSAQV